MATLTKAALIMATLTKAALVGATLTKANLGGATLTETNLAGSDLSTVTNFGSHADRFGPHQWIYQTAPQLPRLDLGIGSIVIRPPTGEPAQGLVRLHSPEDRPSWTRSPAGNPRPGRCGPVRTAARCPCRPAGFRAR
ncbi:pentapeptide repeat-containing protein [Streptomyces sp. NRRL S-646]|uniref:pentapeptide repeat-containing protein n=1 Tax=Streptomyces sp. NRRL S-646 TaxID=1463917 RepID=UPI00099B66E8